MAQGREGRRSCSQACNQALSIEGHRFVEKFLPRRTRLNHLHELGCEGKERTSCRLLEDEHQAVQQHLRTLSPILAQLESLYRRQQGRLRGSGSHG